MTESSASLSLNEICDAFERAWQQGTPPEIEVVLENHPAISRQPLLEELIAIEAFRRAQRGDRIDADEYRRRFPEMTDQLPHLLQDAHQLAAATEATAGTYIASTGERTVARPSAPLTPGEFHAANPVAGQQLGPYRLVKQLGAGGMGTVWEAVHLRLEKTVALKLLAPQLMADPGLVSRFDREMKAIGKLEHPHLVRAYDAGSDRGVHYLAMEYIDGMDLARYVRERGPLSVQQTLHVLLQAAEGLAEAHRAQMIHRDIKPANLMLTRKGVVKVTDLGLARLQASGAAQHDGTLTAAGQILGTPDFMAPEQWDDTHTVDGRCDLYALGCTLFFLLTGSVPYRKHTSLMQKMRAHLTQPMPDLATERQSALQRSGTSHSTPPTLPTAGHDLPDALVALYQRLVAKDPQDRFATAEELITALRAIPASATVASTTVPTVTKPTFSIITDPELHTAARAHSRKPRQAGTGMVIAIAILLIAGVGIGAFSGLSRFSSKPDAKVKTKSSTAVSTSVTGTSWQGWPADAPKPAIAPFDAAQAKKHQEEWAAYLKVPVEYTNSLGMKFRLIPPGEFLMGSTDVQITVALQSISGLQDNELQNQIRSEAPQHRVIITKPYYLGVHQVTEEQYLRVMQRPPEVHTQFNRDTPPYRERGRAGFPLSDVMWIEVTEFCSRLCELEHLPASYASARLVRSSGYLLPTEAQWEQGCRAGTPSAYWCGDGDQVWKSGWCISNSEGRIHIVGELNANPYGLFDTIGNLFEWCQDRWSLDRYATFSTTPAVDPEGPSQDTQLNEHVLRGGSFGYTEVIARSAARRPSPKGYADAQHGARLALTVDAVQALLAKPKPDPIPTSTATAGWQSWPAGAPKPAIAPFNAAQAKKHQEEWAAYLKVPVEYTNSLGMKFRLIPPGEFLMGSSPVEVEVAVVQIYPTDTKWRDNVRGEAPRHKVILTQPFYLGVHEVTQAQYRAILKTNPSVFRHDGSGKEKVTGLATDHFPVDSATWSDAAQFCGMLCEHEQLKASYVRNKGEDVVTQLRPSGYVLPSEAQWEHACRAGTTTLYWSGEDLEGALRTGWFLDNSDRRTHTVGDLSPNSWGLFDMAGNVEEWVSDRWAAAYYEQFGKQPTIDPGGAVAGVERVTRGGHWERSVIKGRSASRSQFTFLSQSPELGFRVALTLDAVKMLLEMPAAVPIAKAEWHGWPADAPKPAIAPFDAAQAKHHQEEWAAYLKVPVEYTNSLGMKFRLIPPGEFLMGSTPAEIEAVLKGSSPDDAQWRERIQFEAPQHKVILTQPIYLGVNEVMQTEYEQVMGLNPSHFAPMGMGKDAVAGMETTDHPVETVSWNDAAEFCAKISKQEKLKPFYFRTGQTITPLDGTGYRLPSEAEWEFACRAGTATKYWIGDKDEDLLRAGWFGENSGRRTHAAGELKANPFGLADMHGNVCEWVQDGWDATYYQQFQEKPAINPNAPSSDGFSRVLRGGLWNYPASNCSSSNRWSHFSSYADFLIGFRVALPVDAVKVKIALPPVPLTQRAIAEAVLAAKGEVTVLVVGRGMQNLTSLDRLPPEPFVIYGIRAGESSSFTDREMAALRGLPYLFELQLSATTVTDAEVGSLASMSLGGLSLGETPVTNAGLALVAQNRGLRQFTLPSLEAVTPENWARLASLPRLRWLGATWSAGGIGALRASSSLRTLSIGAGASVEELRSLRGLPHLQSLRLNHDAFGDDSLPAVQEFAALRCVGLTSAVSKSAAEQLQAARPDLAVIHPELKPTETELDAVRWIRSQGGTIRGTLQPGETFERGPEHAFIAESVFLPEERAVDDGFEKLRGLRGMEAILIPRLERADAAAETLSALSTLTDVHIDARSLSSKGFAALATLPELEQLTLSDVNSGLPADDWGRLSQCRWLWNLTVYGNRWDSAAFGHVAKLTELKLLRVDRCENLHAEDIKTLESLPNLEWLSLSRLSAEAAEGLTTIKSLRILNLQGTPLSPAMLDRLSAALPHCAIFHDGGFLSPRPLP